MPAADPANRRRAERVSVHAPATCRAPATPHRGTVVDISYDGCRVKLDSVHVPMGSTVILDLLAGSVSGQVAWSEASTSGIRFHRRLPSDLAVHFGVEEAPPPPAPEAPLPPDPAHSGLSHWVRRFLGIVGDGSKKTRVA